jgi:hypothetical protein
VNPATGGHEHRGRDRDSLDLFSGRREIRLVYVKPEYPDRARIFLPAPTADAQADADVHVQALAIDAIHGLQRVFQVGVE